MLLLFQGTTPPFLLRTALTGSGPLNFGQTTTSPRRFYTNGTSQSSVATPVTLSGTTATGALQFWCGLS